MSERKRVLYVEDSEDTSFLGGCILEAPGFSVVSAKCVNEALRLAAEALTLDPDYRYDLYLLDVMLPDGNGLELCRRLREFDPDTPVIFFTAKSEPQYKEQAFEAGARAYIGKPALPDELVETINTVLAAA